MAARKMRMKFMDPASWIEGWGRVWIQFREFAVESQAAFAVRVDGPGGDLGLCNTRPEKGPVPRYS